MTDTSNLPIQSAVSVRYGLSFEARKIFARARGSLDLNDAPDLPNFLNVALVPQKGDIVRWEAIDPDVNFVVAGRMFRFLSDGGLEINLMIEAENE